MVFRGECRNCHWPKMRYITGWMRATREFLEGAMIFDGVANDPELRMEALFKSLYGDDFIKMVSFRETKPDILDTDVPAFIYAARVAIWKLPDYETT